MCQCSNISHSYYVTALKFNMLSDHRRRSGTKCRAESFVKVLSPLFLQQNYTEMRHFAGTPGKRRNVITSRNVVDYTCQYSETEPGDWGSGDWRTGSEDNWGTGGL